MAENIISIQIINYNTILTGLEIIFSSLLPEVLLDIKIRSALQKDVKGIVSLLKSLEGVWQKDWRDDYVLITVNSIGYKS